MRRDLLLAALLAGLISVLPAFAEDAVGVVNTAWVVPHLGHAWIEPLHCRRLPGGGLYNLDSLVVQRDLGDSLRAAITYLETHPDEAPGFVAQWRQHDLYFAWPNLDQPRGGPSAGVAFAVAAYSALLEIPVRQDVGVTGGIDAAGQVLPVGGIPLKLPAALAAGLRVLCIPARSGVTPKDLPFEIARRLRVVAMHHADEAFFEAFGLNGPEAERYDRVMTLFHDARAAIAAQDRVAARLALDEWAELAPNDYSAMRLQDAYANVDMRPAARQLLAAAARYEADGLLDEALRAAQRGWSYADEPLRAQHRELMTRLERESLPADLRAVVDRAKDLAEQGAVGQAWRLLDELLDRAPQSTYLRRLAEQWEPYGVVALLEDEARRKPDDVPTASALAAAYREAGVPASALPVYAALRRREPEQFEWVRAAVDAALEANQPQAAAEVLRESAPRWSEQVPALAARHGIELSPPRLEVTGIVRRGNRLTGVVTASDDSGPPQLIAQVGDRWQAGAVATRATLELDLGRLDPDAALLRVTARDRFGNHRVWLHELTASIPDAAAVDPTPAEVWVRRPGPLEVPPGTLCRFDGAAMFPGAALVRFRVGELEVAAPPFRLDWRAGVGGAATLEVVGAGVQGQVLRQQVQVTVVEPPLAWLSPAQGQEVGGTIVVRVAGAGPETTLLLDGRPFGPFTAAGSLALDTSLWPAGAHHLGLEWHGADGTRRVGPALTVDVPAEAALAEDGDWPFLPPPAGLAALGAEPPAEPFAVPQPRPGPLRLELPAEQPPRTPPAIAELAVRIDQGWPGERWLVVGFGDALAASGPQPFPATGRFSEGPLVTTVWQPEQAGTYRLELPDGPAQVTVEPTPPLEIIAPRSGLITSAAPTLRLRVPAVGVETVRLLDGDRVLGEWPAPLTSDLRLTDDALPPGYHVLRLVGTDPAGRRLLSPPVLLEIVEPEAE